MSAESGYLRHGPYDIRGYNAGDLSLDITPTSIWVNGHVTTVAPTVDLHAATKKYVDDAIAGGGDPTEYTGTIPIAVSEQHVISVGAADPQTSGVVTTGAQSFAGVKTFQSSPVVPAPTTDLQAATKKYVDDSVPDAYTGTLPISVTGSVISVASAGAAAAGVVTTGAQTVAGVKTFSSSPIVPTPTTDMQAATKKYVDDSIATPTSENAWTDAVAVTGAATGNITLRAVKCGNIVMLEWGIITGTGTAAVIETGTSALPAWATPARQLFFQVTIMDNNDTLAGQLFIDTTGKLTWARNGSTIDGTRQAFTGTNTCAVYPGGAVWTDYSP